ncbi:adenylate/guanylate cyclase domain-containing protein, partial [bacterium]
MREAERYIRAFSRYLPSRITEKILQDPDRIHLEGEKRFVTVLFGDLSGFTSLTEKLEDPEKIVEIVNRYFMRMLEIVEKYGGDVDKFLGDAIMVIF